MDGLPGKCLLSYYSFARYRNNQMGALLLYTLEVHHTLFCAFILLVTKTDENGQAVAILSSSSVRVSKRNHTFCRTIHPHLQLILAVSISASMEEEFPTSMLISCPCPLA